MTTLAADARSASTSPVAERVNGDPYVTDRSGRVVEVLHDWRSFDVNLTPAQLAGQHVDLEVIVPSEGIGYLYVIEFSTGVVKVGQTGNPRRRLAEHSRDASAYGVTIAKLWLSIPHANYLDTEVSLISGCAMWSTRSKQEYFHEMNWSEAVEYADHLANGRIS